MTMTSCQQFVTSLSFFQFMANLQPSGSRIRDAWSIKFTALLIVTFNLIKPENRTKKSQHSSHTIGLSKGTIFATKCCFFSKKNPDISKIKEILGLKGVFSETRRVCAYAPNFKFLA